MGKSLGIVAAGIGVASAGPFTAGRYTIISQSAPPVISEGRLLQLADAQSSISAPDISAAANTFVVGVGSGSRGGTKAVLVGPGLLQTAAGPPDRTVAVGGNIDPGAAATDRGGSIWIGWDFVFGDGGSAHGENTFVGMRHTTGGLNVAGCVSIGNDITISGGDAVTVGDLAIGDDENVTIGKSATTAGGVLAVAVGKLASGRAARVIAVGDRAVSNSDNQISIGADLPLDANANSVRIGRSSEVFEANSWGLGGDQVNGTEMRVLRLGPNTLTGYGGLSIFLPSAAAGTNIAAPNTTIRAGISTGNSVTGGRVNIQSGTQGASGGTYQTVLDRFRVKPGGVTGVPTIALVNQISTPGALAATLLNSPISGNPAVWMEIEYNGVLTYVPGWQ